MTIFSWFAFIFWIILWGYWLISSFHAKKSVKGKPWWSREFGIRLALVIVAIFIIRTGAFDRSSLVSYQFMLSIIPAHILPGVIGDVLCAAGVAFAIWARIYLGRNWGMPMTLREGHELVTSGPYAWVRHPIYTGFLLAVLGSAFADGSVWLVSLVLSGIYFVYSAKTEEKTMIEQFPDEYPGYMKRTKMLIPFIW
ncbi:MAG TPA: isoprenylcysteine carboxylmethyltransferase family protein [Candidatus Paceibacterota bacterium]|nr:isoprenylcysteine carboxylmethyltransferase family protein [Candidatus Paceibacterota bacterium]